MSRSVAWPQGSSATSLRIAACRAARVTGVARGAGPEQAAARDPCQREGNTTVSPHLWTLARAHVLLRDSSGLSLPHITSCSVHGRQRVHHMSQRWKRLQAGQADLEAAVQRARTAHEDERRLLLRRARPPRHLT